MTVMYVLQKGAYADEIYDSTVRRERVEERRV